MVLRPRRPFFLLPIQEDVAGAPLFSRQKIRAEQAVFFRWQAKKLSAPMTRAVSLYQAPATPEPPLLRPQEACLGIPAP